MGVQDLMKVRRYLMPHIQRNRKEREALETYGDLDEAKATGASSSSSSTTMAAAATDVDARRASLAARKNVCFVLQIMRREGEGRETVEVEREVHHEGRVGVRQCGGYSRIRCSLCSAWFVPCLSPLRPTFA